MENDNKNDFCEIVKDKWWLFLIVIVLWLVPFFICLSNYYNDSDNAINTLFSGLAFVGMLITLIMQKQELELQRQELKETRNEMKSQTKQFETQNLTLKIQLFENTYLRLLAQQEKIIDNMSYPICNFNPKGKDVFSFILGSIKYDENRTLEEFYCLIPYLKHLNYIFKFVDNQTFLTIFERHNYLLQFMSSFTKEEYRILYVHGLTTSDNKIKSIIEKYGLFEEVINNKSLSDIDDLIVTKKKMIRYENSSSNFNKGYPIRLKNVKCEMYDMFSYSEGEYIFKFNFVIESSSSDCKINFIKLKNTKEFQGNYNEYQFEYACCDYSKEIRNLTYDKIMSELQSFKEHGFCINQMIISRSINISLLEKIISIRLSDGYSELPKMDWSLIISIDGEICEFTIGMDWIVM